MRKIHTMKLVAPWFEESWIGAKPFELRADDREGGYNVGDILHMREFRPEVGLYSGREIIAEVTCAVRDERFLQPGFVALGVRILEKKGNLR